MTISGDFQDALVVADIEKKKIRNVVRKTCTERTKTCIERRKICAERERQAC